MGLTQYSDDVSEGYVLFSTPSNVVYLIDNCGEMVNQWMITTNSQFSAYLLPDGKLLKMGRLSNSDFSGGGGSTGLLETYTWEGDLEWSIEYSTYEYHLHHNVEVLPNGNILLIAWERIAASEVLAAGRTGVDEEGLWSEKIVEIKPIGTDAFEEVWVWRAWDHIVQDVDSSLPNFGTIGDHPNKLNLNFGTSTDGDWLHFNYIDYNEDLDQILLCSRSLNEILIIDHSTSTSEASGNTGGNAGKGGDLLFRWGNPINYEQGSEADQKLFGQHNAHWIEEGKPGEGNILVFNNGAGIPDGQFYSTVVELSPSLEDYNYQLENDRFLPESYEWEYKDSPASNFYGQRISSCQRQLNGNTLINEGTNGRYFEVTPEGDKVWQYINPHGQNGPLSQGDVPAGNATFNIQKYPPNYPAFVDKDLSPQGTIELNPTASICLSSIKESNLENTWSIQNPSNGYLVVHGEKPFNGNYVVLSLDGKKLWQGIIENGQVVDINHLQSGLYFVILNGRSFKLILD